MLRRVEPVWRSKWFRAGVGVLLGIAWFATLGLFRNLTLPKCNYQCVTAVEYFRADPICPLDPTCVSPLYVPEWHTTPPRWQGIAYIHNKTQVYGTGVTFIALPNLLFSMLATAALLWFLYHRRHPTFLIALLVLFGLECARWYAAFMSFDPLLPSWPLLLAAGLLGYAVYSAINQISNDQPDRQMR